MAGHFTYWQAGMGMGAYEYLLCTLLLFIIYMCMALCMAEMYSVLSFSGGLYGFVRVTQGPFTGCMVGYTQLLQNTLYMVICIYTMGTYTSIILDVAQTYT
ncbi:APC family permease, partial [archaeon]